MMAAKVWVREPMHCYASKVEQEEDYANGFFGSLRYATGSDFKVDQCSRYEWMNTLCALSALLEGRIAIPIMGICANYEALVYHDGGHSSRLKYLFDKVAPLHSLAYPIGGHREYQSNYSLWDGEQGEARMEMLTALITQCEVEIAACDLVVCDWEDWRDEQ